MKRKEIKYFLPIEDELKKIRGTTGFSSWRMACPGCGRQFTEADIGGTVVSVPRKKPVPRLNSTFTSSVSTTEMMH